MSFVHTTSAYGYNRARCTRIFTGWFVFTIARRLRYNFYNFIILVVLCASTLLLHGRNKQARLYVLPRLFFVMTKLLCASLTRDFHDIPLSPTNHVRSFCIDESCRHPNDVAKETTQRQSSGAIGACRGGVERTTGEGVGGNGP